MAASVALTVAMSGALVGVGLGVETATAPPAAAAPGDPLEEPSCPAETTLWQGATIYEHDLIADDTSELATIDQVVNGVGFNQLDGYYYVMGADGPRALASDFSEDVALDPLDWSGVPQSPDHLAPGANVGDVSPDGFWYIANAGVATDATNGPGNQTNLGMPWAVVDVRPGSETYLDVVDAGLTRLPNTNVPQTHGGSDWIAYEGMLYHLGFVGATADGQQATVLYRFDPATNGTELVANYGTIVAANGDRTQPLALAASERTFGAAYGVGPYLYASANGTGHIWRVDLEAPESAEFVSYGPTSGENDGARCADAPLPLDFGDAPASYGTTMADGGPVHTVLDFDEATSTAPLMLGDANTVDAEPDGVPTADASGDDAAGVDDEGGIAEPVDIVAATATTVPVTVTNGTTGPATLAAWLDTDVDGTFGGGELVTATVPASSGTTTVELELPPVQDAGTTFLRTRLYAGEVADPSPVGTASGGEVEDYEVTVDPVPVLRVLKTSDAPASVVPGDVITYTVTVENTGLVPYTADDPAVVPDDLSGVVDDATYNDDGAATVGSVSYSEPTLTWSGPLAPDATATITYSVTVDELPIEGDGVVDNVIPDPPGAVCAADDFEIPVNVRDIRQAWLAGQDFDLGGLQVGYDEGANGTAGLGALHPDWGAAWGGDEYMQIGAQPRGAVDQNTTVLNNYVWVQLTFSEPIQPRDIFGLADFDGLRNPPYDNREIGAARGKLAGTTVVPRSAVTGSLVNQVAENGTLPDGTPMVQGPMALTTAPGPGNLDVTDPRGQARFDFGSQFVDELYLMWGIRGQVQNPALQQASALFDLGIEGVVSDCAESTPVRALNLSKTTPDTNVEPGETIEYTLTMENTGGYAYTADDPASFTDDLSGVLDSATYNDDAVASAGTASYAAPELSWSGPLEPGESAEVTYTVTVGDDADEETILENAVVAQDSNCVPPEPSDPACRVLLPAPNLQIDKSVDVEQVAPGDTATYTVEVRNAGAVDYTADEPATFTDDLSGLLDDATYNGDAVTDVGETDYAEPVLTWSGPLAAGEVATITYTVTVPDTLPADTDLNLENLVTAPGSDCLPPDPTDPDCFTDTPVQNFEIVKTSDAGESVAAGETVAYELTVTNTGLAAYGTDAPVVVTDDLSGVLDDATYADDAAAPSGEVVYAEPSLTWTGPLAVGESVTITYSVTLPQPADDEGDGVLANAVTSETPGSDCVPPDPSDPDCATSTPVRALQIAKTVDATTVIAGDTIEYEITVENVGGYDYTADDPASATDDMTDVLLDTTYGGDATADVGTVSVAEPFLTWSGPLAIGDIATITFSVTVDDDADPETVLDNEVYSDDSNCVPPDPTDPTCFATVGAALGLLKTVDVESAAAGDVVTYSILVVNIGESDFTADEPATFTDDQSGLLDDAAYNGDVAATAGAVSYAEPLLSWSGPLAVGAAVEVTYSVTVDDPLADDGDLVLDNVVTAPDSTCTDGTGPGCATSTPIRDFDVVKTADVDAAAAGDTVSYEVVVTNTGLADYTAGAPIVVDDDLSGVVDDATYNDDATAPSGAVTYTEPVLTWTGALAVGESASFSYTVTLPDVLADDGDDLLANVVTSETPGSPCVPPDPTDPECATETPIQDFDLLKTSDSGGSVGAGDVVTYEITVENTGRAPYTADAPIVVTDDFTGALDDATYNDDAAASSGALDLDEPLLTWTGPLDVGATATITFSVTVPDPLVDGGDLVLFNQVTSATPGSNCVPPTPTDPDCVTEDPIRDLQVLKEADVAEIEPGGTVTYTITVENTGGFAYTGAEPATLTDDLTAVLDGAAYNDDVAASVGTATFDPPTLTWSGPLGIGEDATITYTVTVSPDADADTRLTNVVVADDSNCAPPDPTDPDCFVIVPEPDLTLVKSVDVESAAPGDVVTYTVIATNTGDGPFTAENPAELDDSLDGVLDDATYNGDAAATSGTVAYTASTVSWTGPLEVDESATITYSVTVDDPVEGDFLMENVLTSDSAGSNCVPPDPSGPLCDTSTPIRDFGIVKSSDAGESAAPGDVVAYELTVTNTGQADYTADEPIVVTDDLTDVLDDATYNGDAAADAGALSFGFPVIEWEGPLAVGGEVTITYSVTVADPLAEDGDGFLTNLVTSGTPGSPCVPPDPTDPGCVTDTPIRDFELVKTSDAGASVGAGDTVTYELVVTNTSEADYTDGDPITVTDDLSDVLDDAEYNGDAAATAGEVAYSAPMVTWTGPLGAGESVTVSYSVTVLDPLVADGDLVLGNAVTSETPGSNCVPPEPEDPACSTEDPIRALAIAKSADVDEVGAGEEVTYTITVTNVGEAPYPAGSPASLADDLSAVLDGAAWNGDAAASVGAVAFAAPDLSWSGPLGVGEQATITYSVTVNPDSDEDTSLVNAVVGPDSNCAPPDPADPDCSTTTPIRSFEIVKTSDAGESAAPGDTVTYAVTVTNTGAADYTAGDPITVTDDLSDVLDDAEYNGDAAVDPDQGEVSSAESTVTWSGPLAAGESVEITYSVTLPDLLNEDGDGVLGNVVTSETPGSPCAPPDPSEPDCSTTTPIRGLDIVKTANVTEIEPGGTVVYTIEVTNSGEAAYTDEDPATVTDGMTGVLDGATYDENATADIGDVSYAEPTLTWTGALEPEQTATIEYSVTVNPGADEDTSLTNVVVGPDSNCSPPDPSDPDCFVIVSEPALTLVKSSDGGESVSAGDTVMYTVTATNTGEADYTAENPASFDDDLSGVLDDATYNDDAAAPSGDVSVTGTTIAWSGPLAAGDSVTVTYSVTIPDPLNEDGDGVLDNAVTSEVPGANCVPPDPPDPLCTTSVPVRALQVTKAEDVPEDASVVPGEVVTYTVTVQNVGGYAYTAADPAEVTDDLAGVLDDASYNDDVSTDAGDAVFSEPMLTWTGPLAVDEVATFTYSVTVDDDVTADDELFNVVVADDSNCVPPVPEDPDCSTGVPPGVGGPEPEPDLEIVKTADPAGSVVAGDTVMYTVVVTNTGEVDYTAEVPASFTDVMQDVLDDATYDDDVSASIGEVTFSEEDAELAWSGPLAVGESATVTYSVTVDDPLAGDGELANAVLGPPESSCPVVLPSGGGGMVVGVATVAPEMPEGCQVRTPVRSFEVFKTADVLQADLGDVVTYTVSVQNTGTAAYTADDPAGFTDDLSAVLDDATFTGDATAGAGSTSSDEPGLSWSGPLGVDETVTVTYEVTVNAPPTGDGELDNVVVPVGPGGSCTSEGDCETTTAVPPPSGTTTAPPPPTTATGPTTPDGPGFLPRTGPEWAMTLAVLALFLVLTGGLLYRYRYRRRPE